MKTRVVEVIECRTSDAVQKVHYDEAYAAWLIFLWRRSELCYLTAHMLLCFSDILVAFGEQYAVRASWLVRKHIKKLFTLYHHLVRF